MPDKVSTNDSANKQRALSVLTTLLGLVVLATVCWTVYGRTLHYDLIFDDYLSITKNDSIKQLFPLFGEPEEEMGPLRPMRYMPLEVRPLVNLTFALNFHFTQLDPAGFRLWNIVGHLVVAAILWWIVEITLRQPVFQNRFDGLSKLLGLGAALVWMVHPGQQDTVAYVTQRTELQMGLFYALTMLISIVFWNAQSNWLKIALVILATLSSICGMLSKEMMASVPSMVAMYEWTFVGGSIWAMLRRSWILYVGLALSWLPIVVIYASGVSTPMAGFNNIIPAYDYWLTQSNTFFYYWRLTFYPWPLLLHYYVPTLHTLSEAWPGVVALFVYSIATIYLVWRRSVFGFGLLWFFAILSPTLIIPLPHEELAERRLYVTLLAVIPILTTCLALACLRLMAWLTRTQSATESLGLSSNLKACVPIALVVCACVAINVRTLPRLEKSSELWDYVLEYQPENYFALGYQGAEECKKGEVDSGLAKIYKAYDMDPTFPFVADNLMRTLDYIHDYPRLLVVCREQYEMFPTKPSRVQALAVAFEKNGMIHEAIEKYRETIKLHPKSWDSHASLATLLAETGRINEAIQHFEISVDLKADSVNCTNLFMLYLNTMQGEKALKLAPKLLKATRKEKSAEEADQLERDIKQFETQFRAAQEQKKLEQ
ncbi:MAG: hypothetical protein U0930_08110 [Pirellulales bacterium]